MQLSVTVQSADHSKDANLPQGLAVQCGLPHTVKNCKNIHAVSRNISVLPKMRNIENWLFKSATSKDIKQLKASRLPQVLAVFVHLQSLRQLTSLWDYWLDCLDETGSIASSFRAVDTLSEGQQSMQLSVTVQSADHSKDANLPQGLAVQCGLPHTVKNCKNIHAVSRNISVPHKMRNIESWLFKSATSKDIKQLKASRLPQVLAVFVHLQSLRQLTSLWDYWLDCLDETGSIASSFRAVDTLSEGQQSMQLSVTVQSADHSKDANLPQGLAVQCGLPHTVKNCKNIHAVSRNISVLPKMRNIESWLL